MRFVWDPSDLNPEQAAAVTEPSSIFLIACPGSGKTRTLTYKIAYELSRRTDKRMVVAITYTHRAADEIQERIEDLGVDTSGLWIGTIHAFCLEWILKPYGIYSPELARGYRVIDPYDRERLLERLCAQYKGITHWDCDYYVTETGYQLGCVDTRKHPIIQNVLKEYFKELSSSRQIDFELILWYAYCLMRDRPPIAVLLSRVFSHILVDEYQDTKQIQYSILTSILRAGRGETKILIVGDPNQAIYGSLGGYAMPLDEFRAQAGIPIKEFALSLNYRSSERIISYFSNYSVHASKITGAGKDAKFPSRITYNQKVTRSNVHDEIVRLIRKSLDNGYSPENICVLAPQWVLLASTTRKLVAMLPDQQFDGPGLIPFSNNFDNFWFKVSKVLLTDSSPALLIRRLRWANEVIKDLDSFGVDTKTLTPRILPLRLITSTLDSKISVRTSQMSLNTTLLELLLCRSLLIFLVLSNNCTLISSLSFRTDIFLLLFTRAIRKSASSMLPAASQLFLLIIWRSPHALSSSAFRASTNAARFQTMAELVL